MWLAVRKPTPITYDVTVTKNRRLCSRPHSHDPVILFVLLSFILLSYGHILPAGRPLFTRRVRMHLHRRRSLAVHTCGALVGGCTLRYNHVGGVIAGQARHNSSNVGGVTAGQVGLNSNTNNNINKKWLTYYIPTL